MDEPMRRKIALFTNVESDAVFTSPNIDTTIYKVPLVFSEQQLDLVILRKLGVESRHSDMKPWLDVMKHFEKRSGKVRIGIIGKYMELHDAYKSLYEALFHAGLECDIEVELVKVDSTDLEKNEKDLNEIKVDGVLVPGGFGQRGINGMVKASAWARENKVPYMGICLGMQIMVIDWGRNVLKWNGADSTEFSQDSKYPVVSLLEEQINVTNYGGTMRLGAMESIAVDGTHILAAYGDKHISERHRHRYEFSNQYRSEMVSSGLILAAFNPDGSLVECVEWPDHPWGVGVQFHPEFKSKPTAASPLFREFISAVKKNK